MACGFRSKDANLTLSCPQDSPLSKTPKKSPKLRTRNQEPKVMKVKPWVVRPHFKPGWDRSELNTALLP